MVVDLDGGEVWTDMVKEADSGDGSSADFDFEV